MIFWERVDKGDLIGRRDPGALQAELETLRASAGWKFVEDSLRRYASDLRNEVSGRQINMGDPVQVLKHNEKVVCASTIDSVFLLVEEAQKQVKKRITDRR